MKAYIGLFLIFCFFSCKKKEAHYEPNWTAIQNYYSNNLTKAISLLNELRNEDLTIEEAKRLFELTRHAFKKAEPYASYLNPDVGHRVNGPALPIFKEDNQKVLNPVGLQALEESIYQEQLNSQQFIRELDITIGLLETLKKTVIKKSLNPQRFFIATHQQLLRIISLGITGFDTPASNLGIKEAGISLQSLAYVYKKSIQHDLRMKDKKLDEKLLKEIEAAIHFINEQPSFEDFDRYTFIKDYMNPITRSWVAIRQKSGLWNGNSSYPFNFDAPTFFESNSFNAAYFTSSINRNASVDQIALGEKLFFDKNLSKTKNMACATCHHPDKGYSDNKISSLDNKGNPLQRNTPTLINSVYQRSFFWDGRSQTLLDQISSVFTNTKEFDNTVHQFSEDILQDSTYVRLFKKAYGGISNKNTEVIKAISSYISTLNGFDSKFDKNIRGEEDTFTDQEKLGFNLFTGKALCATCHFIPLTNGTVPPFYTETEKEVIGVPKNMDNKELDNDYGFYWKFEEPLHKGMFKTPTVRNVTLTAPYMHNGVYESLDQVMEFYNLGGGAGLGFNVAHQTLPFDKLELDDEELDALVAYLKTLTDNPENTSKLVTNNY
ncbi:cytochrome-c peroxidase [Aquimarina sp. 2-A2]|uniref:cytochrome-c peroxidase n=1 Tax=Aquimarina sp. 2-A2 TaxID=3382644 RepID=UPI00387F11BD